MSLQMSLRLLRRPFHKAEAQGPRYREDLAAHPSACSPRISQPRDGRPCHGQVSSNRVAHGQDQRLSSYIAMACQYTVSTCSCSTDVQLIDSLYRSGGVGHHEIVLANQLLNGAISDTIENLLRQVEFVSSWTTNSNSVQLVQRLDHAGSRAKTASDVTLGLLQLGDDHFRKFDKVSLSLLGGLSLVLKRQSLVCAARKLNPVKAVLLELCAENFAVLNRETTLLELGAVEFDANAKRLVGNASANSICDLKDDSCPVRQRAAVLVCPQVGRRCQELCQEIATTSHMR